MMATGGYAFRKVDDSYVGNETGVNNEGALVGAEALAGLIDGGTMLKGVDYGVMKGATNNQNFREINLIIETLSGGRPDWFTDSTLARTMVMTVNVWLGYPYMMLLAMGYL